MAPKSSINYMAVLQHPNTQRLLNLIKMAEHGRNSDDVYSRAFSNKPFDPSKPHPGTVYTSKSGYRSAAHGAYQIMPDSWKETMGGNLPMTRENQDLFAVKRMMTLRGVDPRKPITRELLNKLAPEWASLPTLKGTSYYGQPVKAWNQLKDWYDKYVPKITGPKEQKFKPNAALDLSISPAGPNAKPSAAADFLTIKPGDFSGKTRSIDSQVKLPGLYDIANAAIGNIKGKSSVYGARAFDPGFNAARINTRSYGTSMDLGRDLSISGSSAGRAVASSGYTWGSTAGASNSWKTGFGL